MEGSKRKQIEQRLKIQKIQQIHQHFDKDKDGYLNHAELTALQTITSGQGISRKKYKTICNSFDCKPSQGLTFRALLMTYSSGGEASINSDFDAVFGINRTEPENNDAIANVNESTTTTSEPKQNESVHGHENGVDSEIKTVKSKANPNPTVKETPKVTSSGSQKNASKAIKHSKMMHPKGILDLLHAGDDPIITRTAIPANEPPQMMDMLLKQVPSKDALEGMSNTMDGISGRTNRNDDTNDNGLRVESKELSASSLADTAPTTNIKEKNLQSSVEVLENEGKVAPIYVRPAMEGIANMSKSRDHPVMEGSVYEDFLPKRERNADEECCACTIM